MDRYLFQVATAVDHIRDGIARRLRIASISSSRATRILLDTAIIPFVHAAERRSPERSLPK